MLMGNIRGVRPFISSISSETPGPSNETLIDICGKIIEFGLIFLILFAPLAFGSVYVWAFSIMEIIVFSMMIALVVRKWVQGEKISFPLFFPVIAFLSLIFFQMIKKQ